MEVSKRITITNIGATEKKFPGRTWEQVHNFNFYHVETRFIASPNFYFPNPLPREVEGKQMQFSS